MNESNSEQGNEWGVQREKHLSLQGSYDELLYWLYYNHYQLNTGSSILLLNSNLQLYGMALMTKLFLFGYYLTL